MATLLEIKTLAASYLDRVPSDFTVNGQDMWLLAANQVRKTAELEHDFEFNRKIVSVTVNGTTGGDLGNCIDVDSNPVTVKTVLEVGLQDDQLNLIPVEWTTVAESLERQRQGNRWTTPRYPSDNWSRDVPYGLSRFTFSGDTINRWPKTPDSEPINFSLFLEVYSFDADWTANDVADQTLVVTGTVTPDVAGTYSLIGTYQSRPLYKHSSNAYILFYDTTSWYIQAFSSGLISQVDNFGFTSTSLSPLGSYIPHGGSYTGTAVVAAGTGGTSNVWTTYGQQYLLWATIVQLNKLFKVFVPRQEGNLPPPTDLMAEGLQTLVDWDANKYEQFRRHNR